MKKAFKMTLKAIFIIFKGLSFELKSKKILKDESPTLMSFKRCMDFNIVF